MMKQRQKNKFVDITYRRLDKEKGSGSDSGDETELFVRNKPQKREIPSMEKEVEDGDTLQSLAIRYHCTIADLKRLNNIHRENEIFAKRTVKVPLRPFTMALAGVHISGTTSPITSNEPSTSKLIDIESLNTRLSENLLNVPNGSKNEVNEIIFNSHITQKPCDRLIEELDEENCEEVHLLPVQNRSLPEADAVVSRLNCSGVDGDISWIALIVCIVIVVFAIPLIYVFYIAEHPEKFHHHIS
ncbi:lysM and putative peptidoglycan-binding domain-containing protein 3 [Anoplophora glabripennis]|uniref:lysM and putative peptidoglycan-binding domain-containing protein 3 n=1 Tax=Anoplophora glabripennis TaxID=217634 RepID=UPI000873B62E|nr:lysM and putative peptidoglycan-binding domain-containing protein 3 [Anoplophora glabripennis]